MPLIWKPFLKLFYRKLLFFLWYPVSHKTIHRPPVTQRSTITSCFGFGLPAWMLRDVSGGLWNGGIGDCVIPLTAPLLHTGGPGLPTTSPVFNGGVEQTPRPAHPGRRTGDGWAPPAPGTPSCWGLLHTLGGSACFLCSSCVWVLEQQQSEPVALCPPLQPGRWSAP